MSTGMRAGTVPAAEATVVVCAYTERRWDDLAAGVAAARAQGPAEVLVVIDHDRSARQLGQPCAVLGRQR